MARVEKNSRIDNLLMVFPSGISREDEEVYHEPFHYAATAEIPAAWTLAAGGGAGAVAGIGATQTPRGALALTTGTTLNNEATAAFGAVVADITTGVDWYFRFKLDRITDCRFQLGLRVDGNNYALLQFADATESHFQFLTRNAGGAVQTHTSAVLAKQGKWYLLHLHAKPLSSGVVPCSAEIWSSEAATSGWQRLSDGNNVIPNDDAMLPYAAAKLTLNATSKSLLLDDVYCFNPKYSE